VKNDFASSLWLIKRGVSSQGDRSDQKKNIVVYFLGAWRWKSTGKKRWPCVASKRNERFVHFIGPEPPEKTWKRGISLQRSHQGVRRKFLCQGGRSSLGESGALGKLHNLPLEPHLWRNEKSWVGKKKQKLFCHRETSPPWWRKVSGGCPAQTSKDFKAGEGPPANKLIHSRGSERGKKPERARRGPLFPDHSGASLSKGIAGGG